MFALVSLMCFYLGTSNLMGAFRVSFSDWGTMQWLLLVTGIGLMFTAVGCMWQANKDYKKAKEKAYENQAKLKEQRQKLYFEDDIDGFSTDLEASIPQETLSTESKEEEN